ncbi:HARBI1 [Mytilus edulis]|uniref:Putative nuclease HARBI1 n=1 Tax=Mytilus edulis TaxID=6550 RepID=A0A8S3V924_MYTED|nr:HARBI1 [Mytilus edulis]
MAALLMPPLRPRKDRVFRGTISHLTNLNDDELRRRYRFGKDSIAYLCNLLQDRLRRPTNKATALTVEQQVCIALRFYASGSFLQVIGDTLGYDKGTVSRVVNDVTDALIDIKDDFVSWPTDVDSINRIKCGFYRQSNFPNVLGCIDCTHVRIQAPSDDEPSYVNRKGYHSINVQAVRMKPEKVCRIFGACAVLVNDDGAGVRLDQPVQVPAFLGVQDGRNTREHVARVFFNH